MTFNGIPLHPMVVHAAVVFSLLAPLAAIVWAVVPRWRVRLRWPVIVLAVLMAVSVYAARITGQRLRTELAARGVVNPWITLHVLRAHQLTFWAAGLAVVMVLAAVLGGRSRILGFLFAIGLVVLAAGTGWWVYLTGDAGAQAVWHGIVSTPVAPH